MNNLTAEQVTAYAKAIAPNCKSEDEVLEKVKAFMGSGQIVDENGDAMDFELAVAPAEAEAPAEDEVAQESADPEALVRTIQDAVRKEMKAVMKSQPSIPAKRIGSLETKSVVTSGFGHRVKSFKGPDAELKACAFGNWFLSESMGRRTPERTDWLQNHGIKVMQGDNNFTGGAFVPDEFLPDLIRLVEDYGVFRASTRVVPMSRDTLIVPRRTSGLTAYALGESDVITASDVGTGNVELTARKWGTLTRASSELMEDSAIAVGDLVATEIALAFSNKQDEAGFNGDGTSTYHGIVGATVKINDGNHTASIATAVTGNTSFAELDLVDIHELIGLLPKYAMPNAKFYLSQAGFANSLQRLGAAQGGVTWTETEAGPQMRFLGFPVEISQVMNSTLTAQTETIIMLFGDLTLSSTFGDRRSMQVATSSERYFDQDQIAIRGIERYDIVNHDLGDTSTPGPLVALKTPAS